MNLFNSLTSVQDSALVNELNRHIDPKLDTSMSRSIHTVIDSTQFTLPIPSEFEPEAFRPK